MSYNRSVGNAAEAFVARWLQKEAPLSLVIPLQQDYGADLVQLFVSGEWCLYEVKSSKTRRQALRARLTPAEDALKRLHGPLNHYKLVKVLRIPGRPDRFEVLYCGP